MKYEVEFDVRKFEFWAGAKDVYNRCLEEDRLDDLQDLIENVFDGCTPSDTNINDFVWFEAEDMLFGNEE